MDFSNIKQVHKFKEHYINFVYQLKIDYRNIKEIYIPGILNKLFIIITYGLKKL